MTGVLDMAGQMFRIFATENYIAHCDYFSAMVGHILFYTRATLLILRDFNEPKDHSEIIGINGFLDGWVDGMWRAGAEKENGLGKPSTVANLGVMIRGGQAKLGNRKGKLSLSPSWLALTCLCKIVQEKLQCLLQNFCLYLCEARWHSKSLTPSYHLDVEIFRNKQNTIYMSVRTKMAKLMTSVTEHRSRCVYEAESAEDESLVAFTSWIRPKNYLLNLQTFLWNF